MKTLTVGELINVLKTFDPSLPVCTEDSEGPNSVYEKYIRVDEELTDNKVLVISQWDINGNR